MSMDWYDMIAKRNGGYKNNATYTVEGLSGEAVFEEKLVELIKNSENVLDAGCGHGEFTLKMSKYTKKITGFDNSKELIKIANKILVESKATNLDYVFAGTKDKKDLPFQDESFDLIYARRGPTSILKNANLLKSGGIMVGIHSACKEAVEERLANSGLIDIEMEVYDKAMIIFPNEKEFEKYRSSSHGSLDYSLDENKVAFKKLVEEHTVDDKIMMQEWRYIWSGKKQLKAVYLKKQFK